MKTKIIAIAGFAAIAITLLVANAFAQPNISSTNTSSSAGSNLGGFGEFRGGREDEWGQGRFSDDGGPFFFGYNGSFAGSNFEGERIGWGWHE